MNFNQPEGGYLLELLFSVLHDRQPTKPPQMLDWEKLRKLAVRHSVANMVFYSLNRLDKANLPSLELWERFQKDYKKGMAKEATQHIAVEQILQTFEEQRIACLPLKGYLLKYLYPKPDMRVMADIDILVKDEETEHVKSLLLSRGFSLEHEGGNHDVYYKVPFMNLEMHRRLISENSPYSAYLSQVWDRAFLKGESGYIYQLSLEDTFVYILIHLTKHYANGGTGIRSIMDIWLYLKRYRKEMDWNYLQAELEMINLWTFGQHICELGEVWFGKSQTSELYEEMTGFILSSGVYGTKTNALLATLSTSTGRQRSFRTAKQLYRLKLFFPELQVMKTRYPLLAKLPIFLPVFWMLRGMSCMLFKPEYTLQMINNVRSVSEGDVSRLRKLKEKVGL